MGYKDSFKSVDKGELNTVYFLHGREEYLIDKLVEKIVEKTVEGPGKDLNYEVYDGDYSVCDMIKSADSLPVFNPYRLIVMKNGENLFKLNTESQEYKDFMSYIKEPSEATVLVVEARGSIDKRKAIFKGIKSFSQVVDFGKLDENDLKKWVKKQFSSNGINISNPVLFYFIKQVAYLTRDSEKTLYELYNEIQKLVNLVSSKGEVESEDIDKIIEKPMENNIFSLVDAIGDRNGDRAFKVLNDLVYKGTNEVFILTMVTRHFRILNDFSKLKKEGYTAGSISKELGLHQYVGKKYSGQASKFSPSYISTMFNYCAEFDEGIKTGKLGGRLAIELLIAKALNTKN
jgi:DNA polymerase-3 subunit delta